MRIERPAGLEVSGRVRVGRTRRPRTLLDGPFAVIGRDPHSDLVLPGTEVSRRHAFLQVVAGGLFCIDLDSRTKLRWAGEATQPLAHGWLDPGTEVRIGPHFVRLGGDRGADPAIVGSPRCRWPSIASTGSSRLLLPRAGLEVPIHIGKRESLLPLDSQLTLVGRSESCQVVLATTAFRVFTPP